VAQSAEVKVRHEDLSGRLGYLIARKPGGHQTPAITCWAMGMAQAVCNSCVVGAKLRELLQYHAVYACNHDDRDENHRSEAKKASMSRNLLREGK
jgi:hypothetical protein